METFVIEQMPQLSSGIYIHDFKFNKTVIVDTDNNRCFIMALNRDEIQTPKTFMDFAYNYQRGMYDLDVDEIRRDTIVVTPALENVCYDEYGYVIVLSNIVPTGFFSHVQPVHFRFVISVNC